MHEQENSKTRMHVPELVTYFERISDPDRIHVPELVIFFEGISSSRDSQAYVREKAGRMACIQDTSRGERLRRERGHTTVPQSLADFDEDGSAEDIADEHFAEEGYVPDESESVEDMCADATLPQTVSLHLCHTVEAHLEPGCDDDQSATSGLEQDSSNSVEQEGPITSIRVHVPELVTFFESLCKEAGDGCHLLVKKKENNLSRDCTFSEEKGNHVVALTPVFHAFDDDDDSDYNEGARKEIGDKYQLVAKKKEKSCSRERTCSKERGNHVVALTPVFHGDDDDSDYIEGLCQEVSDKFHLMITKKEKSVSKERPRSTERGKHVDALYPVFPTLNFDDGDSDYIEV
ncbi:hypothetical protein BaRGS_00000639 [Batillaria attramentaria]|uniref:Uncharacterized protein n=1 Tax=Batillaria attramentaria TaxID=370345 RepID=A0ABD0M8Z8_9CAEN